MKNLDLCICGCSSHWHLHGKYHCFCCGAFNYDKVCYLFKECNNLELMKIIEKQQTWMWRMVRHPLNLATVIVSRAVAMAEDRSTATIIIGFLTMLLLVGALLFMYKKNEKSPILNKIIDPVYHYHVHHS